VVELVLERTRARGDDRATAARERRDEVGERLARPGARFDHERLAGSQRLRDRLRHRALPGAGPEARQPARERAFRAEENLELLHLPNYTVPLRRARGA